MVDLKTREPSTTEDVRSGYKWLLLGALALVLVAGAGAIGWLLGYESGEATAEEPAVETASPVVEVETAATIDPLDLGEDIRAEAAELERTSALIREVPASAMELHDSVVAALLAEDSEAFAAHFAEGAVWVDPHGTWSAPASLIAHLDHGFPWVDFQEIELTDAIYLNSYGNIYLATEWMTSGMSGDPTLGEKLPFSTPMRSLFEIRGDELVNGYTYFSQIELYNDR